MGTGQGKIPVFKKQKAFRVAEAPPEGEKEPQPAGMARAGPPRACKATVRPWGAP